MKRLAKFLPALAMFGAISTINAAPDPAPPATPAPEPAPAKTIPSVAEMNVGAASMEAKLETNTDEVVRLRESVKKQKDVIKLNCVNDRLVQLKAQRNIADELHTQLNAALAKNSDERIALYSQLQIAAESVNSLTEQAKACVGEPELYKTESGVTVDSPVVPDDPTTIPPQLDNGVEPPGYASPWD